VFPDILIDIDPFNK